MRTVNTRNDVIDEPIWKEDDSLKSCIDRIHDQSDDVRFAVSYEIEARHQINKHNRKHQNENVSISHTFVQRVYSLFMRFILTVNTT